ncbi:MAG: 2-oxoacid:acceptor oxidoreductase family protein [candidate division Zixibacteria bacterium]|jgi:2-oxoglutarate ferredoxin oxidoreductase subunit gamma|nr:2-oxoacid:acceptor oxidoreductase family protein [candidate division Zixibacteria bacterium]
MALRYSIRFSGAGGQGLIQAARILAEAAAIYDNKNAAESCSYGPEARGSESRAEIIISDETIDYPKVDTVDFLMALTQEAYDKYIPDLVSNGILVVDQNVRTNDQATDKKLFSVPFLEIAESSCGRPNMVNIVALGFFAQINDVTGVKYIRQAILARIPKKSEDIYMKAYEAGLEAAQELEK